jgi:hypothetical protein
MVSYVVAYRIVSYHYRYRIIVSYRIVSYRIVSYIKYIVSSYRIASYGIVYVSYCIVINIVSCRIVSYGIVSYSYRISYGLHVVSCLFFMLYQISDISMLYFGYIGLVSYRVCVGLSYCIIIVVIHVLLLPYCIIVIILSCCITSLSITFSFHCFTFLLPLPFPLFLYFTLIFSSPSAPVSAPYRQP